MSAHAKPMIINCRVVEMTWRSDSWSGGFYHHEVRSSRIGDRSIHRFGGKTIGLKTVAVLWRSG